VGCGQTWLDPQMVIVDPETFIPCSDQQVGEIWVSGPNVAQGYWNRPKETEQTFQAYLKTGEGPFLRTGDLGFLKDSELFVKRHACRIGFLANTLKVVGEWHQPVAQKTQFNHLNQDILNQSPDTNVIQIWLITKISQQVGIPPDEIDIRQPFHAYHIDSVKAVGLSGELADWLGKPVSPTLIYDYPTIEALAQYLNHGVLNSDFPNVSDNLKSKQAIAIIGVSCRFPKANDINDFWQLLKNGVDGISEVPKSRWTPTNQDIR
jgi:acyl carrier protein